MIDLQQIKNYFPAVLQVNPAFRKYMLKEYVQLLILDFLSASVYIKKITFIGGTTLRLIKGIDRFSENLYFDCSNLSQQEFLQMTDDILTFLLRSGFRTETNTNQSGKSKEFYRNIYFPELLYDMELSAYKAERFSIKIGSQNQESHYTHYKPVITNIKRMGFFFPFPVPPDPVLCAMKISALLSRRKGRDYYDVMFLLGQISPDYDYLSEKCDIKNLPELKEKLLQTVATTNMKMKSQDFKHLLFDKDKSQKILLFKDFVNNL